MNILILAIIALVSAIICFAFAVKAANTPKKYKIRHYTVVIKTKQDVILGNPGKPKKLKETKRVDNGPIFVVVSLIFAVIALGAIISMFS